MNINLAYSKLGTGTPVLILHGLFGCKRNWTGIAKGLANTHQVFTLDMRNHGESRHSSEMTYPDMAADITRFIEQHKLGRCPVIGHSMGGKASMILALTRPELVERLLILDIAPVTYDHDYSDYVNTMKDINLSQVSKRGDVEPIIASVVDNPAIQAFLMQNLVTNEHGGYRWRVNLDAFTAHMPDILGFPEISDQHTYTAKTLFLGGRQSDYIAAPYQSEIKRLFPTAEVDFIDDAGHWVHADQPQAVLARFQAFLK